MYFQDIADKFDIVETEKDYWFIRTSKGKNFSTFTNHGFIGIGWNYITTQDLRDKNEFEIKAKIARLHEEKGIIGLDQRTTSGKTKITSIYNKIKRFESLKEGDLVIIPNKGSESLSFGYITDEKIFNDFEDSHCDLHKRRHVSWIITKKLVELDPIFYKIIFSKHAVSKLNFYDKYIDKVIKNVFIKDDESHMVLDVMRTENIPVEALSGLIVSVRKLTSLINEDFELEDDLSDNGIKLNLQSPGNVEFIYKRSKSLLVLSLMLSMPIIVSCSHSSARLTTTPENIADEKARNIAIIHGNLHNKSELSQEDKDGLVKFATVHYDTIADAKNQMDTLAVNVEKLNSIN